MLLFLASASSFLYSRLSNFSFIFCFFFCARLQAYTMPKISWNKYNASIKTRPKVVISVGLKLNKRISNRRLNKTVRKFSFWSFEAS